MPCEIMKFLCLFVIYIIVVDVSYAINEPCNDTDEICDVKEKSICLDNTCQCDELSKYSEEFKKCLSYATQYNTLCYADWQCEDFIGQDSQCLNNACLCKSGYRWYQGKCQKYAKKGDACDDELVCLDGDNPLALICSDKVCQCSEGYYDRGEDCRFESKEGEECAITSDCVKDMFGLPSHSHCELGKCIKNTDQDEMNLKEFNNTFTYSEQTSYLKTLIRNDLKGSSTESPVVKCPNGVSSDLSEEECTDCYNTLYFKNVTCICAKGFFLQDGQCISELGMKDPNTQYEADKDCPIKPGKAVNGVCYCKNYWFQDSTNKECKKTTLEFTKTCLDNDWCKAMGPYAYCDSSTQKCQCSSQAVLNETSFYCELKTDANFSTICLEDTACPLYETCIDEKCQCDDGFFKANDTSLCLPKVGYSCQVRDCEHIDNAVCSNNETCQCKSENFVSDGFVCLKMASNLTEECQIKQQCRDIPHADCLSASSFENATSQCLCTDEYLNVDGFCYAVKIPGSQCSTQLNCTIILGDTFECRNNLCQCPLEKKLSADNTCIPSSTVRIVLSVMPLFLAVFLFMF